MAALFVFAVLVGTIVLAVLAFVRSQRIDPLERRIEKLETALGRKASETELEEPPDRKTEHRTAPVPSSSPQPLARLRPVPARRGPSRETREWEELIGRRWLAWVGVAVLILGAGFGLKFAFENRWIGDLGRVLLGLFAGVCLTVLGHWQLRLGRKGFSQALTAGGVTLLYLSVYASYGFYQLIDPTFAFVFLTVIVIQAHLLASLQNAPGIALMGQLGGFLAPVLLDTGEDRYWVLFSYILLLNAGAILAARLRHWRWVSFVPFALTHAMFWSWHESNYHPEKLGAALTFVAVAFALFVFADLQPQRPRRELGLDNWARLFLNPLLSFAAAYALLEPEFPDWMGTLALAIAVMYAALAKSVQDRIPQLFLVGIAGLFVTLAIPIQLDAHWVTLAWALQATVLAWLHQRMPSKWLALGTVAVFATAIAHYLSWDAPLPWMYVEPFRPVFNADFASAAALVACLLVSATMIRKHLVRQAFGLGLAAVGVLWLASTFEAYSYFAALARETPQGAQAEYDALIWTGQATVSVIWAVFASSLVAAGMRSGIAPIRWTGLGLFGITVCKALMFDIDQLEGGYRVSALLVLGLLLVCAAWAYQRMSRRTAEP